jgi:hypothetical protein
MHTINLIMGDRGGDGHGKINTFIINSNLSLINLRAAYKLGSRIIEFDFINSVAVDGEENILKTEYLNKLKSVGFDQELFIAGVENKRGVRIYPSEYANIVLFICKLGDNSFEYKKVDIKNNWDIG